METKEVLNCLGALSQETRLMIFRALVPEGEKGIPAGELAERLDVAPNVLSFHLKSLSESRLVESARHGRSIVYSIKPKIVREFFQYLMEDCCQGREELCKPGGNSCC